MSRVNALSLDRNGREALVLSQQEHEWFPEEHAWLPEEHAWLPASAGRMRLSLA
jgi:hypothetical protein